MSLQYILHESAAHPSQTRIGDNKYFRKPQYLSSGAATFQQKLSQAGSV